MPTTTTPITSISPTAVLLRHREAFGIALEAYDRFASVVEELSPDDWSRPTDCSAWSVRDLVGHMVGAMRSAASTRELLSQQRQIKARRAAHGGSETDRMTQVQVERTAALDTATLVAECRALAPRAARGRRRIPAPARRFVRLPVEAGGRTETWTLGYLIDVILTRDAWMHRVDLCRAVGAHLELTPDHDGRIIADIVGEWARRHRSAYHLVLTGPAGGTFSNGQGGTALEIDAVEFCRILSGREPGTGLLATEVPF